MVPAPLYSSPLLLPHLPPSDSLVAFLRRHGVPPSSCMMGRWWVSGLLRLGTWSPAAADLALEVLTAPTYPSWLDMLAQGATTTMEAWRPADKVRGAGVGG